MKHLLFSFIMLLAAGLLNAQTSGYNPDSPEEPFLEGYSHILLLNVTPAGSGDYYGYSQVSIVEGDTMTIYVYPNNGYRFVEWRENGSVISTVNPIVYTMGTSNSQLTAVLTYDPTAPADPYIGSSSHRLKLIASPSNGGYFDTESSNYIEIPEDSVRLLYAYPKSYFRFVNWTRNGVVVSTANPYRYIMGSANDALVANFVYDPENPNNPGPKDDDYLFEDNLQMCSGDTVKWRGRNYTVSGVYYDSLISSGGYDSVYKLTLTVYPVVTTNVNLTACENGQLPSWAKSATPGVWIHCDTLMASTGCDSIINTVLTVHPTYSFSQMLKMSTSNVPYMWHGRSLYMSGIYYDSLQTINGCDSIYELDITFVDPYLFRDSATMCQGETYTWRSRRFTASGIYYDSLKTADNVDSVYELTLTVNPVVTTNINVAACANEPLPTWAAGAVAGNTYHHYDTLSAVTGCDSIIHTALKVNPTYFNQQSVTWPMASGNYNWHGKVITGSGVYYDSLTTVNTGCDSVFQLNITFADKYLFEESYSICQGDYYDWRGQRYTQAGVYYDSLKTSAQVDSIYKLTLTVNQNYSFTDVQTICQGSSYLWHNRNLTVGGVYYDSLITTSGCDSVYELTLTVNPAYFIQERHAICQGDVYQWHGRNLNAAGVYYDSLQTAYGCDSVYELTLRVNQTYFVQEQHSICQGENYKWHNRNFNAAGVYYDSLLAVSGCDSVYELTLTVNPTYKVEDSAELPNDGSGYEWHGKVYKVAGDYVDTLATVFGCDSICTLHLKDAEPAAVNDVRTIEITLAPNPIRTDGITYIYADWTDAESDNMTVEVVTMSGMMVSCIKPESFPIPITGINSTGIYFIRITTGSGESYIRKLIIR